MLLHQMSDQHIDLTVEIMDGCSSRSRFHVFSICVLLLYLFTPFLYTRFKYDNINFSCIAWSQCNLLYVFDAWFIALLLYIRQTMFKFSGSEYSKLHSQSDAERNTCHIFHEGIQRRKVMWHVVAESQNNYLQQQFDMCTDRNVQYSRMLWNHWSPSYSK